MSVSLLEIRVLSSYRSDWVSISHSVDLDISNPPSMPRSADGLPVFFRCARCYTLNFYHLLSSRFIPCVSSLFLIFFHRAEDEQILMWRLISFVISTSTKTARLPRVLCGRIVQS